MFGFASTFVLKIKMLSNFYETISFTEISIFLCVLIISLNVFHFISHKIRYKIPPGPAGLPFVGYLPFLETKPHKTVHKLSKKYGNVFSCYLGQNLVVFLNDWPSTYEAYNQSEALDRAPGMDMALPNGLGFAGINGKRWVDERKFTVKAMKNIGLGRPEWEHVLMENAEEIVKEIKNSSKKTLEPESIFCTTFAQNIVSLIFGKKLSSNDKLMKKLVDTMDNVNLRLSISMWFNYFPFILLLKLGVYSWDKTFEKILYFDRFIKNHTEETIRDNSVSNDTLVKIFCKKADTDPYMTKRSLYGNMAGLVLGGSETTRTGMMWLLLAVAKHPQVQDMVHKEIDSVLGKDIVITWSERDKLPYTYATILESMRWKIVTPLTALRQVSKDTKFQGYDLPEGTYVTTNAWALHNDPKYWPEPRKFKPERFLSVDGKTINNSPESYVPFSIGKRNCPGKNIALMEIFHYFVAVMRHLNVLPPKEGLRYGKSLGLTYRMTDLNILFISRNTTDH